MNIRLQKVHQCNKWQIFQGGGIKGDTQESRKSSKLKVGQFSGKANSFDIFSPNLPKSGSKVGNSEYCRNKNQHP